MLSNQEIDDFMKTVRIPHKYCWPLLKSNFALYEFTITEQEWKDWLVRNPKVVFTSRETGIDESTIGGGFIPIKRERPKR